MLPSEGEKTEPKPKKNSKEGHAKETNPKFLVDRRAQTLRPIVTKARKNKTKPKPKKFKMRLYIAQNNLNFSAERKPSHSACTSSTEGESLLAAKLALQHHQQRRETERERASEEREKQGEQRALLRYVEDKGQLTPLDERLYFMRSRMKSLGKLNLPLFVSWVREEPSFSIQEARLFSL